jgi:hypothetical protein
MNQPTNQRRESRLEANTPVTVKVLKILGEPAVPCNVIDMSGSGLRVTSPNPIPCGAEVKVESNEAAIYAEVCRCEEQDGTYSIGLIISELRPR